MSFKETSGSFSYFLENLQGLPMHIEAFRGVSWGFRGLAGFKSLHRFSNELQGASGVFQRHFKAFQEVFGRNS